MTFTKNDFVVLEKFDFDRQPVGVKFSFKRPDLLDRLEENTTLCTMLKRAQEGNAFYVDKNNLTCGSLPLGMQDLTTAQQSGEFAAALKVFEEPRSASRLYPHLPMIPKGSINYAAFNRKMESNST